ncbi:MAG: SgcJ/EcaC family oxidoreductase [Ardenticatenaceae bacterium]
MDENAIREVVDRIEAAWNMGDGAAFAAPFAEDADYVVVNGMYIKGRQAIAEGHRQIFDTVYKGSHNRATIRGIRFLRDDVAVAHVEWHLKFGQGDAQQEARAITTFVLTRKGNEWQVDAFQNTPIAT